MLTQSAAARPRTTRSSPTDVPWQEKVRQRIGWPKQGSCATFARAIGAQSRTVYGWLRWDRSPHNEARVLEEIARALRVPLTWLTDGRPGDPPAIPEDSSSAWIAVVDRSPLAPQFKQLGYALGDPKAAKWLADAYERFYLPIRAPRAASGGR